MTYPRHQDITDLNTSTNEKQTSALVRCSLIVTTFSLSRIVKRKFWTSEALLVALLAYVLLQLLFDPEVEIFSRSDRALLHC